MTDEDSIDIFSAIRFVTTDDKRLTTHWASDTVLPFMNHTPATSPNYELGGLSPAELKFGTLNYKKFQLPPT